MNIAQLSCRMTPKIIVVITRPTKMAKEKQQFIYPLHLFLEREKMGGAMGKCWAPSATLGLWAEVSALKKGPSLDHSCPPGTQSMGSPSIWPPGIEPQGSWLVFPAWRGIPS
uniref:Uncharacterized protein n=1 Tax=Micrurus spixii TaxID=129469 RepID=A0A2D4NK94_9SAUR